MAAADLPSSDSLTALNQEVTAAQAALALAITQLALDQVTADFNPTAANLAAVKALQERVTVDEALLSSLYVLQAAAQNAANGAGASGGGGINPSQPGYNKFGAAYPGAFKAPPIIPIIGVVESGAPSAEDAWAVFKDNWDEIVKIGDSLNAIEASTLEVGTEVTLVEVGGGLLAAIADLPVTIIALGMLLIVYMIGKLLVFVGKHFPNPSILGWHPLNFIRAGIEETGQALVDVANTFLDPIITLIMTPIHLIKAIFQRVVNAIAGAHNKSTTLYNHTIPQSKLEAVTAANTYTDEGIATLQADQVQAIANLAQAQNAALELSKVESAFGTSASFDLLQQSIMARIAEDQNVLAEIQTEIATEMPLEVAAAAAAANATEDNALSAHATTLQATLDTLHAELGAKLQAVATNKAIITADEQYLAQELISPNPDLSAVASLEAQITQARVDIATSITGIETLESQITGISDTLGQIHTTQVLRTSNLTPTNITAITALATVVGVMAKTLWNLKTKVDTCVVDNCDQTNPNNIHNVLKKILEDVTAAAEIGYVASAIADPVGFADAQAPIMEGVDSTAVGLLNSILGL
jgi:hypothetical protein